MRNHGQIKHSRNACGYSFDLDEIAKGWAGKTTFGPGGLRLAGISDPQSYTRHVFQNMFCDIIREVMISGNMFKAKFGAYHITIYMRRYAGKELIELLNDGYLPDYEYHSNDVLCYPHMHVRTSASDLDQILTLDDDMERQLLELRDEGMTYEHDIQTSI